MSKLFIEELEKQGMSAYTSYLEKPVLELLSLIDGMDEKRVAQIIHELYRDSFFKNDDRRNEFISFLSEKRVLSLLERCPEKICDGANIWESLQKIKKSKLLTILNREFQLETVEKFRAEFAKDEIFQSNLQPKYALFPHQLPVFWESRNALVLKQGRAVVHMPTGAGKTRTAMHIICEYMRTHNKNVIWIADTKELCDQAADEFQRAWYYLGNREVSTVKFYGRSNIQLETVKSLSFIIGGIGKLHAWSQKKSLAELVEFSKTIGFVVFDEAHKILAPTYEFFVNVITETGSEASLLGLSATPGRGTYDLESNELFAGFFDGNKITLDTGDVPPIKFLQQEGYLSYPSFIKVDYEQPQTLLSKTEINSLQSGADYSTNMLKKLGADAKRNFLIIQTIQDVQEGNQVIVFAPSVASANAIYTYLSLLNFRVGVVTGETSRYERESVIERYLSGEINIIVNFGVLTTGFDAPKTNVCIIARPTTSISLYSQMVGRALRGPLAGGTRDCKIYTVIDLNLGFNNPDETFTHFDKYFI